MVKQGAHTVVASMRGPHGGLRDDAALVSPRTSVDIVVARAATPGNPTQAREREPGKIDDAHGTIGGESTQSPVSCSGLTLSTGEGLLPHLALPRSPESRFPDRHRSPHCGGDTNAAGDPAAALWRGLERVFQPWTARARRHFALAGVSAMPLNVTMAAREMGLDVYALLLLRDDMTERAAVRTLIDRDDACSALRLALRLMPRGYVVPWLCHCVRAAPLDDDALDGLLTAEAWLRERGELRRRNALAFAVARHYKGLGALVAASAAWSEGVMPECDGGRTTSVPPQIVPVVAAAALLTLASMHPDPEAWCRELLASAAILLPA